MGKTVSEQQDSVRSSSSTTHSCVLEAWLARTLARVMEAVLWCVPPSMIQTPMFRLVSWPGVFDAERMELLESTLMLPRPPAGSTRQSLVTTELHQDFSSYFGYTSNVCQTWYDNKISELNAKKDSAGRFGKIFEKMIGEYTKCYVNWEQPTAPLVDISSFERANDGYSEPQQEE